MANPAKLPTVTDGTVEQAQEFVDLMLMLSPDQRAWFIDQIKLHDAGQPNVIDGTASLPDWIKGARNNAA